MAVKCILNGFFRSGTSIVWKKLKENNPKVSIFYEPCHNDLFIKLKEYSLESLNEDRLHRFDLWSEYFQEKNLIENLRKNHPNIGKVFPSSNEAVLNYIENFESLKEDSVLQTNRWHFCLEEIATRKNIKVVQIIRNPIDVYNSLIKAYKTQNNLLYIKSTNLLNFRAFRLDEMYKFIYERFGFPSNYKDKYLKKLHKYTHPFEIFLYIWTWANFEAVKTKNVCHVLVYEDMVNKGDNAARLFDKIGLKFDFNDLKNPRKDQVEKYKNKIILKKIEELGVSNEYREILKNVYRENGLFI